MRRQASRPQGFTLIEAAVAVGIIAILASAAAPLVMKALNQQRERTTRDGLKIAFEAMFGSRERRVANMRADYGFDPAGSLADLGQMTNRRSPPAPYPLRYGIHNNSAFNWGWNGPYWTGPTRTTGGTTAPLDAWGKPIQLRLVTGAFPGFQLISGGSNGRIDSVNSNNRVPQVDDLVFPEIPGNVTGGAYSASLYVDITNKRSATATGNALIRFRKGDVLASPPGNTAVNAAVGNPQTLGPFSIPAGPTSIVITINSSVAAPLIPAYSTQTVSQVVDLMPGETRTVSFQAN